MGIVVPGSAMGRQAGNRSAVGGCGTGFGQHFEVTVRTAGPGDPGCDAGGFGQRFEVTVRTAGPGGPGGDAGGFGQRFEVAVGTAGTRDPGGDAAGDLVGLGLEVPVGALSGARQWLGVGFGRAAAGAGGDCRRAAATRSGTVRVDAACGGAWVSPGGDWCGSSWVPCRTAWCRWGPVAVSVRYQRR